MDFNTWVETFITYQPEYPAREKRVQEIREELQQVEIQLDNCSFFQPMRQKQLEERHFELCEEYDRIKSFNH